MKKNKKATFFGTFSGFFAAIVIFLAFRWAIFEPFVIPSGSMIPTLLINDHIFVSKLAYGLRWPYFGGHIFRWATPRRGDVVVFVGITPPNNYLIKRVIGLPGETVEIFPDGVVQVDGQPLKRELLSLSKEKLVELVETKVMSESYANYLPYEVTLETKKFLTLLVPDRAPEMYRRFELSKDEIFVMGDNRDHSQDGRYFGPLPLGRLVGKAWKIWLSCDRGYQAVMGLCNENELRRDRFLKSID